VAALVIFGVCLVGAVVLFVTKSPLLFPNQAASVGQATRISQNTPRATLKAGVTPAIQGIKATLTIQPTVAETVTPGPTETLPRKASPFIDKK
jgi:hypothetical protein